MKRQFEILDTLMAYRRNITYVDCVSAINRIDLVFYKCPSVRNRLKTLFDHMERERSLPQSEKSSAWQKRADLFAELITEIAKACGYDFDHTDIKVNSYHPQGYVDEATFNTELREALLKTLRGKQAIAIVPGTNSNSTEKETAISD